MIGASRDFPRLLQEGIESGTIERIGLDRWIVWCDVECENAQYKSDLQHMWNVVRSVPIRQYSICVPISQTVLDACPARCDGGCSICGDVLIPTDPIPRPILGERPELIFIDDDFGVTCEVCGKPVCPICGVCVSFCTCEY